MRQTMLEIEERLFDEYKMVDNICRDIFQNQIGVKQYIDEMMNAPRGKNIITSWDDDYRKLNRMKSLRNKIAHESAVTDCNEDDITWLKEFHNRLLKQQDPLALLFKADRARERSAYIRKNAQVRMNNQNRQNKSAYMQEIMQISPNNSNNSKVPLTKKKKSSKRTVTAAIVWIEIFIIIVAAAALLGYITNL